MHKKTKEDETRKKKCNTNNKLNEWVDVSIARKHTYAHSHRRHTDTQNRQIWQFGNRKSALHSIRSKFNRFERNVTYTKCSSLTRGISILFLRFSSLDWSHFVNRFNWNSTKWFYSFCYEWMYALITFNFLPIWTQNRHQATINKNESNWIRNIHIGSLCLRRLLVNALTVQIDTHQYGISGGMTAMTTYSVKAHIVVATFYANETSFVSEWLFYIPRRTSRQCDLTFSSFLILVFAHLMPRVRRHNRV